MFVDTKNSIATSAFIDAPLIEDNSINNLPTEPTWGKKSRKVWKPLLRLISRRSAAPHKSESGRSIADKHPNNINLNNATGEPYQSITPQTTAAYSSNESKETFKEERIEEPPRLVAQETTEAKQSAEHSCYNCKEIEFVTVISSASIEKNNSGTGGSCIYGRNCSHEHSERCCTPLELMQINHDTQDTLWAEVNLLNDKFHQPWWLQHYDRSLRWHQQLCPTSPGVL